MGILYRKRKTIDKNLIVNTSKSGISFSVGAPGAWINFGPKRDTVLTLGLPGSGFYSKWNLSASNRKKAREQSKNDRIIKEFRERERRRFRREQLKRLREEEYQKAIIKRLDIYDKLKKEYNDFRTFLDDLVSFHKIDFDYNKALEDFQNRLIDKEWKPFDCFFTDLPIYFITIDKNSLGESLFNLNKKIEKIEESLKQFIESSANSFQNDVEKLLLIHSTYLKIYCSKFNNQPNTNFIFGVKDLKNFISRIEGGIKCKSNDDIISYANCIYEYSKIRYSYFKDNCTNINKTIKTLINNELIKYDDYCTKIKYEHDNYIKSIEDYGKFFNEQECGRKEILTKANNGDITAISILCDALFPIIIDLNGPEWLNLDALKEYNIGYNVNDKDTIEIKINLPDISIIPEYNVELSPAGKTIKYPQFNENQRNVLYKQFYTSFILYHILALFITYPYVKNIILEGFISRINECTGLQENYIILNGTVNTQLFSKYNFQLVNPQSCLESMGITFYNLSNSISAESLVNDDNITWTGVNDSLPNGLLPDLKLISPVRFQADNENNNNQKYKELSEFDKLFDSFLDDDYNNHYNNFVNTYLNSNRLENSKNINKHKNNKDESIGYGCAFWIILIIASIIFYRYYFNEDRNTELKDIQNNNTSIQHSRPRVTFNAGDELCSMMYPVKGGGFHFKGKYDFDKFEKIIINGKDVNNTEYYLKGDSIFPIEKNVSSIEIWYEYDDSNILGDLICKWNKSDSSIKIAK